MVRVRVRVNSVAPCNTRGTNVVDNDMEVFILTLNLTLIPSLNPDFDPNPNPNSNPSPNPYFNPKLNP